MQAWESCLAYCVIYTDNLDNFMFNLWSKVEKKLATLVNPSHAPDFLVGDWDEAIMSLRVSVFTMACQAVHRDYLANKGPD